MSIRRLKDLLQAAVVPDMAYELVIVWTLLGTQTYTRKDKSGDCPWLASVSGGEESLNLTLDGFSQSIGSRIVELTEEFGAHNSVDEVSGRTARLYVEINGRRVLVAAGILDEPEDCWDPETRTYRVTITSPWMVVNKKLAPAYTLSPDDLPTIPQDSIGQPMPIVIGTAANMPLIIIQDWPSGELAAAAGPTATTVTLDDADDWPTPPASALLDETLPAWTADSAMIKSCPAGLPTSGIVKIGTELIGYAALTYVNPTAGIVSISPLFRGWGDTTAAEHLDGVAVLFPILAAIDAENTGKEIVAYTGKSGNQLTGLTRGIYASLAGVWHDTAAFAVCLSGIPIVHAVAGHACYSLLEDDLRERVPESDRPARINYPADVDPSDDTTLAGAAQTIASVSIVFPHLTAQQHVGFGSAEEEQTYYGTGGPNTLPVVGGYFIIPCTAQNNPTGRWVDTWAAVDLDDSTESTCVSDVIDWPTVIRDPNPYTLELLFDMSVVPDVVNITKTYCYWNVRLAGCGTVFDGAQIWLTAGTDSRLLLDWDYGAYDTGWAWIDDVNIDWTSPPIAALRMTIWDGSKECAGVPVEAYVRELGFLVTYTINWGWTNPENTIDADNSSYGTWAALAPDQVDILKWTTGIGGIDLETTQIVCVQVEIDHQEAGSAEGDWTIRHVRLRAGTEGADCGELVQLPLRADRTIDRMALPLPANDLTGETLIIELITMGAMGVKTEVYGAHAIVWTDSVIKTDTVIARDLVVRTVSGAMDSTGALVETPSDVIRWVLEEQAGLTPSHIDDDTFAEYKTADLAAGWKLNGIVVQQTAVEALLEALCQSSGCALLWSWADEVVKFWRWPVSLTAEPEWDLVHDPRGDGNVLNDTVRYSRTPYDDLVSRLYLNYSPRPFTSERRMVRSPSGRRPPQGGGDKVFAKRKAGRLDLPFLLTAETDPTADGWAYARFGDVPDRVIDLPFVGDATSAALAGSVVQNVFSRRRYGIECSVGPWGEALTVGEMVRFFDVNLPRNVMQSFRDAPYGYEKRIPRSLRGIYAVITSRRQTGAGSWDIGLLEWCKSNWPGV